MLNAELAAGHSPSTANYGPMQEQHMGVEPWGYYDDLRELGDLVWDEDYQAWLALSYDLCKSIARNEDGAFEMSFELSEDRPAPLGMTNDEWMRFFGFGSTRGIGMTSDEFHDLQHRWMMRAFSPRTLGQWREALFLPTTDNLIDRFITTGKAELGNGFADLLAPKVIAAIMGLPYEDDEWVRRVGNLVLEKIKLKQQTGNPNPDMAIVKQATDANDEIIETILPFVRKYRDGTADNLISMMWRNVDDVFGPGWEEVDIVGLVGGVWEGGSHSTRNSTANGIYMLLTQPGLRDQLIEGGSGVIKNFIEEVLRLYGPVLWRPRTALRDVEIGSVLVKKGEQVLTMLTASSRDEAAARKLANLNWIGLTPSGAARWRAARDRERAVAEWRAHHPRFH